MTKFQREVQQLLENLGKDYFELIKESLCYSSDFEISEVRIETIEDDRNAILQNTIILSQPHNKMDDNA